MCYGAFHMLILLTSPDHVPNEAALLNHMLGADPYFALHLRKPHGDPYVVESLLGDIDPVFHPRIVLHQQYELLNRFDLKGIHLPETVRKDHDAPVKAISTSFHTLPEALKEGEPFAYFFCSPVFPSISKEGHVPMEDWDLTFTQDGFRNRAVALGGVDLSKVDALRQRGFRHAAVLGAVWQSPHPEQALAALCAAFRAQDSYFCA